MDISQLTNAPRQITLGGLVYRARAFTFAEWGIIHSWIKDNADDPVTEAFRQLEKARRKGVAVSPEAEASLVARAREDARAWPPRLASKEWFGVLGDTPGGSAQFLLTLLTPFQPSITIEQVAEIDRLVTTEETDAVFLVALGADLPPKSAAPTGAGRRRKSPSRPRATTGR